MGKVLRKNKPTKAKYFQSESQRKKTSLLSFIHGSPKLVGVLSVLVILSLITGTAIIQKQRNSEAASVQTFNVSWGKDDANTNLSRWQSEGTPGYTEYAEVNKDNSRLNMSLKSGPVYPDGYQVCYQMVPGGATGSSNFRYTSAEFAYETNEAGANGVSISVNGQNLGILNAAPSHQGGNVFVQRVTVDFAALPGGSMQLGQTIKICNYKIGAGKLLAKKTVSVFAYSFRATYDVVTPDPALAYDVVSKTLPPSTMVNGTTANVIYKVRNTGTATWQNTNVLLGTSNASNTETADGHNRLSIFSNSSDGNWIGKNRIRMQEATVAPGSVGTFSFTIVARTSVAGATETRTEHFDMVQEGVAWFPSKGLNFTVKVVPKPATTTPTTPTSPTTPPADASAVAPTNQVIDQDRWSGWGFPIPANPTANHTVPHSNSGKLTIEFDKYNYTDKLTGCWSTVVPGGNTATDFVATVASNDAGRNIVFFRATGNPDKVLPRATNGKVIWNLTVPVQAGGSISVCSKVENPNNQAFSEVKTLTVSSYQIHGTGSRITDTTKPQVRITNYETGSTVSGTITLKADANDASGITYVEFKQGGNVLNGQQTTAPYQTTLDTTKYPDGELKLLALARDNAGNFNSSNEITVTVKNVKPETTPTSPTTPTTPTRPAPTTTPQNPPSPASCNAVSSAEAESGVRKNLSAVVASDPLHPETGATVLFATNSSVECTLEAPKTGRYAAAARVRSSGTDGIAEAQITLTGIGAAASRTVKAPQNQAYGLIRFNEKVDYRQISQGSKVTVKVTFTNNSSGTGERDRNLWVDKLMLVEIPPEPQPDPNGNTPPRAPVQEPETAIVPCNQATRVEAEDGSLYKGASSQSDASASGSAMVRLATNAQYVECTLSAPEKGEYIVGATVKSDNRPLQDRAIAQLAMAGGTRGIQKDTQPTTGKYDRIRMRVNENTKRPMDKNELVVVRVSVTNASNNLATKKHLLVDNFELIKVPAAPAPNQPVPAQPANEPVTTIPVIPGEDDMEEVSYSRATGAVRIKIEAEKATYKGSLAPEAPAQEASGNKAVRLWSNKNYVEYSINFPATDTYSLDFAGRSENFDGVAIGRIIMDDYKEDIKLISSAKHNLYTSDKKVSVTKGRHTFKVEFINDKRGIGGDRNLLVDFLQVRGTKRIAAIAAPVSGTNPTPVLETLDPDTQTIEAENSLNCQASRQRIACEKLAIPQANIAYGNRALVLNRNQDFVEGEFTAQVAGTYSVGATLRSLDYKGSAKADIYIDGDKVGAGVTPSSMAFKPTFLYGKKFNANSKHKIKVVFINDVCGKDADPCDANHDRNLLVDQFRMTLISRSSTAPAPSAETTNNNNVYDYKFVSMPDFLNADIGDVRTSPFYKPGMPNSISPQWERSLDYILDYVQNEKTKDVFIAGDFVEGEFGRDTDNTGIFGPVGTESEKRSAILEAGKVYYKQGLKRFTDRGLVVYPAVGDHEVGDNPWNLTEIVPENRIKYDEEDMRFISFKQDHIGIYKKSFSDQFFKNTDGSFKYSNRPSGQAEGTAYAIRPNPKVQLISIDVFRKANGTVIASLDQEQLNWVERVLKKANNDGVDWVIVQGHTPIITPVPRKNSSALKYEGGIESELWRIMAENKVDIYLAGEVHDVSARRANGIIQIAHGGLIFGKGANYLTGVIKGDELTLRIKSFDSGAGDACVVPTGRLWGTNMKHGENNPPQSTPCANLTYPNAPPIIDGVMRLKKNNTAPSVSGGSLAL